MSREIPLELEHRIRQLSMNKWSLRRIANHLKKLGHVVSHKTVSNVINKKGKKRQARENGIIYKPSVCSRKVTKSMLVKLDRWTSNPNPLSQKEMAKRLGISQPLVSTIIKRDLKKITRKKLRVHYLSQDNKKNRKTNSRKLYERMSSKKMEFFVTVDEAQVFLVKENQVTKHCYLRRGQQLPDNCVISSKEGYPEHFMIVAGMTGRGPLPLIKIPQNVKISGEVYINYVLEPLFRKYLPKLYPNEMRKLIFHHDKASSHTCNLTTAYLKKLKSELKISFINKKDIPVKGADICPLDFFGFGYLKQKQNKCKAKTLTGVWKYFQRRWSLVTHETCMKVFQNWKARLHLVNQKNGEHTEHVKQIHKRKVAL